MLPYFLLLLFVSVPALFSYRRALGIHGFVTTLLLSVFIGFRYQTGGDWVNYFNSMLASIGVPFSEAISAQNYEPFYALLNWYGANQFGGLVFVNSVCALIFSLLLLRFCRSQPNPWLALTIAIPYLVIVVAMGYTRQSVAIAFEMVALLALQNGRTLRFILLVFIGSLFHKPALSLMSLVVFSSQSIFANLPKQVGMLAKFLLILAAAYGFYAANSYQLHTFVEGYYGDYSDYSSQGAILRVSLTAVISTIFLLFNKYFNLSDRENEIWFGMSAFALCSSVALFCGFLPALVDRLALYLLPIQLFVGSRLPGTNLFGIKGNDWKTLLVMFSFLFLYVWLNFANNSSAWLPYDNILF